MMKLDNSHTNNTWKFSAFHLKTLTVSMFIYHSKNRSLYKIKVILLGREQEPWELVHTNWRQPGIISRPLLRLTYTKQAGCATYDYYPVFTRGVNITISPKADMNTEDSIEEKRMVDAYHLYSIQLYQLSSPLGSFLPNEDAPSESCFQLKPTYRSFCIISVMLLPKHALTLRLKVSTRIRIMSLTGTTKTSNSCIEGAQQALHVTMF